jgi:hypothetical protein
MIVTDSKWQAVLQPRVGRTHTLCTGTRHGQNLSAVSIRARSLLKHISLLKERVI